MRRILFVLIPLILLFAAGISVLRLSSASGAVPAETVTVQQSVTPTPTATQIPTATATLEPTATPTPAPITLPVTNGTPIPDLPYEVITAENVHRLRQIARYGYPRLLDTNPYRLTADGTTIVVGTTLGLEFYDANTQAKTGGFEVEFLRSFDLTPDGQYLLTLAGETLTVWKDGQKVREFNLQSGDAWQLNAAALSPDGALLAVQRKKADWQDADRVDVYRVADGSLVDTVRGNGVLFSPDGQYLASVFDGSVRLYPAAELGQGWEKRLPKQSLPWCGGNESCGLVFSPDGHLAAVIRPSRVDVYQVAERKLVRQVSGWESDGYALPQVQFADGQMLVTTPAVYDRQGNVRLKAQAIVVDIASGEWLGRSEVEEGFAYVDAGQVRTFRWIRENKDWSDAIDWYRSSLTVDDYGRVNATDKGRIEDQKFIPNGYCFSWYSRYRSLWAIEYLPCTQVISLNDIRILVYDEQNNKTIRIQDAGQDGALSNDFLVLAGGYQGIKVWSLNSKDHWDYPVDAYLISASINGNLALAGGWKGELVALGIDSGEITRVALTGSAIFEMAFSPNGSLFATYGADGFIRVWAVVPDGANVR